VPLGKGRVDVIGVGIAPNGLSLDADQARRAVPALSAAVVTINLDQHCIVSVEVDSLDSAQIFRGALVSSTSPVAILPTMTAAPITSAGRFSPLGPLGICLLRPSV
jgi:hypothetical protein